MERTPDEIYDELRELRQTAERVADNIADVASAIQYFTNNLFDEQHNPELGDIVRELGEYLARVVGVTSGEAVETVDRASSAVEEAVNGVLQQDPGQSAQEEPEAAVAAQQQLLFAAETSSNGHTAAVAVKPSASLSQESQAGGMDSFAPATNDQHRPAESSDDTPTLPLAEAIYEPFGFQERVAYAKQCLLSGSTDHRDFDTCFEMHDGEFVVVRLLQLAQHDSQLMQRLQAMKMDDVAGTDGEDYLTLSPEELTHRARQCVGAHQVGQGILDPEFADPPSEAEEQPVAEPYTFEDWQAFQGKPGTRRNDRPEA